MQAIIRTIGFYSLKTRDRIGGTLRTDVFMLDNGSFRAYSHYMQDQDEEIIGFAESFHEKEAVRTSRKELRNKWLEQGEKNYI